MKKLFKGLSLLLLITSITSCGNIHENAMSQNYESSLRRVKEGTGIHVINEEKDFYLDSIVKLYSDIVYQEMYLVKTVDDEYFIISPQSIVIFENYKCPFNHK